MKHLTQKSPPLVLFWCLLLLFVFSPLSAMAEDTPASDPADVIDYHLTIKDSDGKETHLTSETVSGNVPGFHKVGPIHIEGDTVYIEEDSTVPSYEVPSCAIFYDVTITGDGTVNLVIDAPYYRVSSYDVTIENVKKLTINGGSASSIINGGSLTICNVNSVNIGSNYSNDNHTGSIADSLKITNCSGDIRLYTLPDTGNAALVYGDLTIENCGGDVSLAPGNGFVTSSYTTSYYSGYVDISCNGKVEIETYSDALHFGNSYHIHQSSEVKISTNGKIIVDFDSRRNDNSINCSGNVTISGNSPNEPLLGEVCPLHIECGGIVTCHNYCENPGDRQVGYFLYKQAEGRPYRDYHGTNEYNVAVDRRDFASGLEVTDAYLKIEPAHTVSVTRGTADVITEISPLSTLATLAADGAAADPDAEEEPSAASSIFAFEGNTIHITAADTSSFVRWNSRSGSIDGLDADEPNTRFIMPDRDVVLEAVSADSPAEPEVHKDDAGGAVVAVVAGGAAAWGLYEAGTGIYRVINMKGVPMPSNRGELALLVWNRAGRPEPQSTALYADIDVADAGQQKAARWMVEQGLMDELKDNTFKPGRFVTKLRTCITWNEAKQKGLID